MNNVHIFHWCLFRTSLRLQCLEYLRIDHNLRYNSRTFTDWPQDFEVLVITMVIFTYMKEMALPSIHSVDWSYNDVHKFTYFLLLNIWTWRIISAFLLELEHCFKNDACHSEHIESHDLLNTFPSYSDESKIHHFHFRAENK